jgi:sodium pump decarboxylase gamma subunit
MGGLFESGIELMMIGMGTVFSFLTLLVFMTRAMSWLMAKTGFGADTAADNTVTDLVSTDFNSGGLPQHVAAIAIALQARLKEKR